jgi:hypothetical protein
MPRKSKNKSSSLDASVALAKRGRPRKFVAPEALLPFGQQTVLNDESDNVEERTVSAENQQSRRTNPATSDQYYSADEVEFMNALAEFKRTSGRLFPTCSEILYVLRGLGYEKVTKSF